MKISINMMRLAYKQNLLIQCDDIITLIHFRHHKDNKVS